MSPPRVAWKYAWGGLEEPGGSKALPSGTGAAASERLYRASSSTIAATNRSVREQKQREAQEHIRAAEREQRRTSGDSLARRAAKAKMTEKRFSKVMASTAPGRYRKELVSHAAVRGGVKECERVHDVYNYGDMLFQEGMLDAKKKEALRNQELRRREEADVECTFHPRVSKTAKQLPPREHMSERVERLALESRVRQQELVRSVRSETDRECTFRPTLKNRKSHEMMREYGPFLEEMKSRDLVREQVAIRPPPVPLDRVEIRRPPPSLIGWR